MFCGLASVLLPNWLVLFVAGELHDQQSRVSLYFAVLRCVCCRYMRSGQSGWCAYQLVHLFKL